MKKIVVLSLILLFNLTINAQVNDVSKDSLDIPVILVDGVEVQNLDSINKEDIVEVKVIKDENVTKYFYPRTGGIMCVTTKSKKFLIPIIKKYKESLEANKKGKKEGEIYIR